MTQKMTLSLKTIVGVFPRPMKLEVPESFVATELEAVIELDQALDAGAGSMEKKYHVCLRCCFCSLYLTGSID